MLTEVFVSIYTGVSAASLTSKGKKWTARYKGKHLGTFVSQIAAAEAYDNAVRQHLKNSQKVPCVNFPKGNKKQKEKRSGVVKNTDKFVICDGVARMQISM